MVQERQKNCLFHHNWQLFLQCATSASLHRSPGPLRRGGREVLMQSKAGSAHWQTSDTVFLPNNGSPDCMLVILAGFYVFIKYGFIIALRAHRDDPRQTRGGTIWVNKHLVFAHLSFIGHHTGSLLKTSCLINE